MNRARFLCAACIPLLFTTLPVAAKPAHDGQSQKAALVAYLQAIVKHEYSRAYRMLASSGRAYYRSEANFASVLRAPQMQLLRYRIVGSSGPQRAQVFTVEERLQVMDFARSRELQASATSSFTVTQEENRYAIRDSAHPYKAISPNVTASVNGVRVVVRQVAFYPEQIAITLTLQNLQSGFATFLPYNRTVLTDDRDAVYRSIETKDWRLTDKQFFLGLRLAGNAQYTGVMRFTTPDQADPRQLRLEIAPVVREDGAAQPFGVQLPAIETAPPGFAAPV